MAKRAGQSRKKTTGKGTTKLSIPRGGIPGLMDDMRQLGHPGPVRIRSTSRFLPPPTPVPESAAPASAAHRQATTSRDVVTEPPAAALAEVATCLWYLKTKHFKRDWGNEDTSDDDPRVRRTLGRLNKGVDSLKRYGVEIEDPTGKRYPSGGEAMMRPLDFVPTMGLTYEMVTEATKPLVYRNGQLIQRAEVFVAVPPPEKEEMDLPTPAGRNDGDERTGESAADTASPRQAGEQALGKTEQDTHVEGNDATAGTGEPK